MKRRHQPDAVAAAGVLLIAGALAAAILFCSLMIALEGALQ